MNKSETTKYNKMLTAWNSFMTTIGILVIALLVMQSYNWNHGNPTGYKPMVVVSGSMIPVMEINSLVIVEPLDIQEVSIGDIVVYKDKIRDINIVHRVIEEVSSGDSRSLRVKGDANSSADGTLVTSDNLLGKVVYINNNVSEIVDLAIHNGEVNILGVVEVGLIITLTVTIAMTIITSLLGFIVAFVTVGKDGEVISETLTMCRIPITENMYTLVDDTDNSIKTRLARASLYRELSSFKTSLNNMDRAVNKAVLKLEKQTSNTVENVENISNIENTDDLVDLEKDNNI